MRFTSYTSLKSARKSIILQAVFLSVGLFILGIVFWLAGQRCFILDLPLGETAADLDYTDVEIEWEEEAVPIESYEVRYAKTPEGSLPVITMIMKPDKAGQYTMKVNNTYGEILAADKIHVGWLGLAWFWPNAYVRECAGFFSNRKMLILYLAILLVTASITAQMTNIMF